MSLPFDTTTLGAVGLVVLVGLYLAFGKGLKIPGLPGSSPSPLTTLAHPKVDPQKLPQVGRPVLNALIEEAAQAHSKDEKVSALILEEAKALAVTFPMSVPQPPKPPV
jgi:hypothetical protein